MWFGELPVSECVGCILAHSQKLPTRKLAKGSVIDNSMIADLKTHGVRSLTVARLDADDIAENDAASKLAVKAMGAGTRAEKPHTGRVNIYATVDGLLHYDRHSVIAANSISSDITLSVIAPDQWVLAGRMIASAKIISYAVAGKELNQSIEALGEISVHSAKPGTAVLIQTVLPSVKPSVLDKTTQVTKRRLQARSAELIAEYRCSHNINELTEALKNAVTLAPDLILMIGASAISDRGDVLPAAVEQVDGLVRRVGLPVDPGNLLMLAEIDSIPVLGLPGCARSPKHNGLDLLLDRILCDVAVSDEWLNGLCIGGLLGELHNRPQPRVIVEKNNRIAGLILAAGSSRRTGATNKLLYSSEGRPVLGFVIESVLASEVNLGLVVTGHESEQVLKAIEPYEIDSYHCAKHADGMAHSIAAGLSRLQTFDAVLVCLGDMPHVSSTTINQIINCTASVADSIVVPTFEGRRGNPVMIGRAFFDTLLQHEGDTGARFLMAQYPEKVIELALDTDEILKDYDTKAALQKLEN